MSARAVSKYTQKLTGGVGAVFLRFLGPDDRRIIMFDSNDEWWHVEARRGHGPHGASRRRARSSAGRVRGRREAAMLVDRERRADKKKQVSQVRGAKQEVPKCGFPRRPVPWITRVPRAWSSWEVTLWSKILSMHRVGEACAKHQEK